MRLVAARIPIQFVAQIATVFYLRSKWKERPNDLSDAAVSRCRRRLLWRAGSSSSATSKPLVILYSLGSLVGGRGWRSLIWDSAARRLTQPYRRRCFACVRIGH